MLKDNMGLVNSSPKHEQNRKKKEAEQE